MFPVPHLTLENQHLLDLRLKFERDALLNAELYWPFLKPCKVRLLLVVDGLDYSDGNFGLSAFIRTLLDMPGRHVRFQITLAHINNASPSEMMDGEARIVNRITNFRFDNPAHFSPDAFDAAFLFGIEDSFRGRGNDANGAPSPRDRLSDTELRALTLFMNSGGGLFATGDHGSLGRALCHAIPRARNMRLWQSTASQAADDEVSMGGARRNDTNRRGNDLSSDFNDQSDDVPQEIQPKIYSRRQGLFRYTFPHPLLCGPNGMIRVMPDHAHEGECIEPADPNLNLNIGGALGPEYPPAAGGGARPLPEIISTSSVLTGITSGFKDPTVAQSFGGISAYDGHRAGIGRVVTDATWHHFVNVNLTGDRDSPAGTPKRLGFLATPAGQAHFEQIKAYFRNLAVWLSRPELISCMNARLSWSILWSDRVIEAVLSTANIKLSDARTSTLRLIGQHARDVLGRHAGACQALSLVIDLVLERAIPDLVPGIDPWRNIKPENADDIGWFDGTPLIDIALGGGLVALRQMLPKPDAETVAKLDTDQLRKVMAEGGAVAVAQAVKSLTASVKSVQTSFRKIGG